MFTADILFGPSKITLGFSGSLHLKRKVLDTVLYIAFAKWDLPVPSIPERYI